MPARVHVTSPLEATLLKQFGERLVAARESRGLSASALAARLGISRNTLKAAESGDSSVTMGTYVRVLASLGLAGDLALLGSGASAAEGATPDAVARRHARFEAEVAQGRRDARSLVAIPRRWAVDARVTFPNEAFGRAQRW